MEFRIRNTLLTVFVCLIAFGCERLEGPEKPLVYGYPQAEYHRAGSIDEHRNYISMPHDRFWLLAQTRIICVFATGASAQQFRISGSDDPRTMEMKPQMTEFYAPVPPVLEPGDFRTNSAPSDAIVLFDGKDLSAWERPDGEKAGWTVNGDGTMTVNKQAKDIRIRKL